MRARRGRGGVSSLGPCAQCQMVSRMLIASLISLGPCAARVGEGAAAKPGMLSPRPGEARYKNVRAGLARIPANRAVSLPPQATRGPTYRSRSPMYPLAPQPGTSSAVLHRVMDLVGITTDGYGLCDDRNPRKSIEIGAEWTVLSVSRARSSTRATGNLQYPRNA